MKISCIIPVYNEGARVRGVLDVVVGHSLVDEVIVVDDGSTDSTAEVLTGYKGIRVITQKNHGKTYAVMVGIRESKNDIVMLIDSDLIGLQARHITELATPVLEGRADMSITLRKNSLLIYRMLGLDFVSGERVFNEKIIRDLNALTHLPGFGLEVFLNSIVIAKNLRLKVVWCDTLVSPRKSKKMGWFAGMMGDGRMIGQIASLISVSGMIAQMLRLRELRIK